MYSLADAVVVRLRTGSPFVGVIRWIFIDGETLKVRLQEFWQPEEVLEFILPEDGVEDRNLFDLPIP